MKKFTIVLLSIILLTGCSKSSISSNIKTTTTGSNTGIASAATSPSSSSNVSYYFARQTPNVDQQLIKVIDSGKSTLDIAIYSLTKKTIVDEIIKAKDRGINVEIITDKIESTSKSEKAQLKLLQADNIPIKINSHSGLMHLKMTVADNTVTTGSYNYTQAATNKNDEVLIIINDSKMAKEWKAEFETMWNDTANYKDYM